MNQANKSASSSVAQSTPPAPNPSQVSSHAQLQQQQPLLQSSSAHQEGNVYNVSTIPYGGGKVSPLPSTDALMEHHPHNMIPPLGRQNFIQHYTPQTNALLPSGPVFRPAVAMGSDQSFQPQDHDKPADVGKGDSMSLAPPPTFVPPPLNSLFHPPANIVTGSNRNLHI
ncbi:hypothetical protein GQ600_17156 [Phytophthora cactorum]|nr:hypothetical protein GQ600_17156 [Phytophthora cactorum]